MSRSTLKHMGPAQWGNITLALSGMIKTDPPIAVVKGNAYLDHFNIVGESIRQTNEKRKKVELGEPISQNFDPTAPYIDRSPRGNTKMQDYRTKGEAIIDKATSSGTWRPLTRNEQMRLKSLRGRYEKEYQKNK